MKKEMKHRNKSSKNISERENKNKALRILIFLLVVVAIAVLILTFIPKTKSNAQKPSSLRDLCAGFCETNQRTAFCFVAVNVNENLKKTCDELSSNQEYLKYNVKKCENISCAPLEIDQTCVSGLGGSWETPEIGGSCPQSGDKIIFKVKSSDNSPIAGQICCV